MTNTLIYNSIIVLSLSIAAPVLTLSCVQQNPMEFTIQHRQLLKVPSASGVVKVDDALFIIGDNSPWLYKINSNFEVVDQQLLLENVKDSVLSKSEKPDFEAMTRIHTNGNDELLIFGSGSKSPERDKIVKLTLANNTTKAFHADPFYNALRSSAPLDPNTLNLEAATSAGNKLYLFNRELNLVLEYPLDSLLGFLEGKNILPDHKMFKLKLPKLDGIPAKFSGASEILGSQNLVFTASVEDTNNTYDDGAVLGSYIGIIHLAELADGYAPNAVLLSYKSKPISIKIESVEVMSSTSGRTLQLVLVSDSDGGDSELITGTLTW